MWKLKKKPTQQMNKQTKTSKRLNTENKLGDARGEESEVMGEIDEGD